MSLEYSPPPHILIVEDFEPMQDLLTALVQRDFQPVDISVADSIAEAASILRTGPIDMMLLDLRLPDSVGYSDVRKLFREFPLVATAIVTGFYSKAEHQRALADGARAYYDKEELIEQWKQIALCKRLLADVRGGVLGYPD